MLSSRMLRLVALIRSDVSEERIASIIRPKRISELGTTLAVHDFGFSRQLLWRMPSSEMLCSVALVGTDVSEEPITSIVFLHSVLRLMVTANVVPSTPILANRSMLFASCCHHDNGGGTFLRNVRSYKRHTANIPEEGILYSHRSENLKCYIL
jgi:hypothetical protein